MSKITERHQARLDGLIAAQASLQARYDAKLVQYNTEIDAAKAAIAATGAKIASLATEQEHEGNVLIDRIELMKELLVEDMADDAADATTPAHGPAEAAATAVVLGNADAAIATATAAVAEVDAAAAVAATAPGGALHIDTLDVVVPTDGTELHEDITAVVQDAPAVVAAVSAADDK
jgi:hypothetical protein